MVNHLRIGTLTTVHTADVVYAVPAGAGWVRCETTVTGSDPWRVAELLLAEHGLRCRGRVRVRRRTPRG